jgi:superfamily II DNA or RNA helicase
LTRSTPDMREYVLRLHRKGEVKVISNRFVLREGIDLPWVRHIIAATIFGSLQSCLQALGRGLRADRYADTVAQWGEKTHCTIQDHGGNYWRHGSLNSDREWNLGDTAEMVYALRADKIRDGKMNAPVRCPKCSMIWGGGNYCNPARGGCGFRMNEKEKKGRAVVTTEGELKLTHRDYFPKRAICKSVDGLKLWEQMYHRAKSQKWNATFREAIGLFAYENHSWPDPSWPLMPKNERDRWLKVQDVPMERLIQKELTNAGV